MLNLLADEILGLPLWAFIVIVAAAVLLIVIIIVVAVVLSKKSHKESEEVKTEPVAKTTTEAKPAQQEKKEEPEEKPVETKATESKPASKPAASKTTAKPAASKAAAAKPANKVYHISKRKEDNMWQIKAAGGEKAIKLFKTQKEAISYCKTLADNQEASIMIHKEDGSFRKLTY